MTNFDPYLALSPYEFDQTPGGWAELDATGDYLSAAQLIELYLVQNQIQIQAQSKVSKQSIHFHAGQEYAMHGASTYNQAINHFRNAKKPGQPGWNMFVDGTIAYLEHDQDRLKLLCEDLSSHPPADAYPPNTDLLKQFLESLRSNTGTYAQVYDAI